MRRTALHNEVLRDSSVVYRWLTLEQAQDAYVEPGKHARRNAERLLASLQEAGWLNSKQLMLSVPLPSVAAGPLYRWSPGDPDNFDAEKVSYLARLRWKKTTLGTPRVWFATKKARRLFGGAPLKGTSPGRWDQANHDVLATSIALHIKKHRPNVFAATKGEDVVAKLFRQDKLSDFVVGKDPLNPSLVVDCAGSYSGPMAKSYFDRSGTREQQADTAGALVMTTKTKKKKNVYWPKKKEREELAEFARLCLLPVPEYKRVFMPDKSMSWARGKLHDYRKKGLLHSHEHKLLGGSFYFLTKHAARCLGVNAKYTHASAFRSAGRFYDIFALMQFSTANITEPGKVERRLLRRPELAEELPEVAAEIEPGDPNRFAIDAERNLFALRVVRLADTTRLVTNHRGTFTSYLERPAFQRLIVEQRFKLVLIVPSTGKKESIEAELLLREKRLVDAGQADSDKAAFAMLFRRTLKIYPSDQLGQLIA